MEDEEDISKLQIKQIKSKKKKRKKKQNHIKIEKKKTKKNNKAKKKQTKKKQSKKHKQKATEDIFQKIYDNDTIATIMNTSKILKNSRTRRIRVNTSQNGRTDNALLKEVARIDLRKSYLGSQ